MMLGRSAHSQMPAQSEVCDIDVRDDTPLLQCQRISKTYGSTAVLKKIDLHVGAGEIVGIAGENGAGKSTLVKIIAGILPHGSYEGFVIYRGKEIKFRTVSDAEAEGIVLIPQELEVAPELTVAENMMAGQLPMKWGLVRYRKLHEVASFWLDFFSLKHSPFELMSTLSIAEQRMVIIASALQRNSKLLILDEPAVAMNISEREILFRHLRHLRSQGIGIIFISHDLEDLSEVADRIVVFRNGAHISDFASGIANQQTQVIQAMLGRETFDESHVRAKADLRPTPGGKALEVRNLIIRQTSSQRIVVNNISFQVNSGEILGLYGLVGSGAMEVGSAIYGLSSGSISGSIVMSDWSGIFKSPKDAISHGVAYLVEDRQSMGCIQGHSISWNMSVSSLSNLLKFGFVRAKMEERRNLSFMKDFRVRANGLGVAIDSLSGGNQQKVLLARTFGTEAEIIILKEPTLGVDIGARQEIYQVIHESAMRGKSFILISSDVREVASQCERILVMRNGAVIAERKHGVEAHELVELATGGEVR